MYTGAGVPSAVKLVQDCFLVLVIAFPTVFESDQFWFLSLHIGTIIISIPLGSLIDCNF
jgi:hypothetical protein